MAESEHYNSILRALDASITSATSRSRYLEVMADKGLTERFKKAIPSGKEIAFSFMTDKPDIGGVIENDFGADLLVAEIKEPSPKLQDICLQR
jgi:hypothetical protein